MPVKIAQGGSFRKGVRDGANREAPPAKGLG